MTELPYNAIIMDLDRILLRTDKTISAYTREVLGKWKEAGAYLFAATARPERAIMEYRALIGFHSVTTLNGARTITPASVLENAIGRKDAESILRQLERIDGTVVSVETGTGLYANTEIPVWQPAVIDDLCGLPAREKIYKILVSHPVIPPEQIVIG